MVVSPFRAISLIDNDVTDIAVASDGKTVYVAVGELGRMYRSHSAGQNFKRLTAYPGATPTAVSVAVDNKNAIAVTDGAMVYISQDGGTTWTTLPALPTASSNATITDVAVAPARPNTILGREYAIAVADPATGATNTANQQGDVLIVGFTAAWRSAGRNNFPSITGGMDYMAVAFDPKWVGTRSLIAVGASVGAGTVGNGVYLHLLNEAVGFEIIHPTQLHDVATDYRTTGADAGDIVAADIALPSNLDVTTGSGRRVYVGIGTAATYTNDDVYRVDNTVSAALGAVVNVPIKSVAYRGTINAGTLFVGRNDTNMVRFSANPESDSPTWTATSKAPTGTTATVVRVAMDIGVAQVHIAQLNAPKSLPTGEIGKIRLVIKNSASVVATVDYAVYDQFFATIASGTTAPIPPKKSVRFTFWHKFDYLPGPIVIMAYTISSPLPPRQFDFAYVTVIVK